MAVDGAPGDRWVYETCDRCTRRSTVSFWVTNEVWAKVVGDAYHRVCTTCFDEMADERSVEYVFGAVNVISWSQGAYGEWPHLDVPCAECVGRADRKAHFDRSFDIRWILEREKTLGLRPEPTVVCGETWCEDPDCPEWASGPPFWNHTHPCLSS